MEYVEYIKVGTGESWAVRDAEARTLINSLTTKVNTNTTNIGTNTTNISNLTTKVNTNTTSISTLNTNIGNIYKQGVSNVGKSLIFSQTDSIGNASGSVLSSYPTLPGIYRVGPLIAGLPSSSNGYGVLLYLDAGGYYMNLYIDANDDLFFGRTTGNTPTSWWKATGSNVSSKT